MRLLYVITATGAILSLVAAFVHAYRENDEGNVVQETETTSQENSQGWFGSISNEEPRCCSVATLDSQDAHYLIVSTLSGEIIAYNVNNYGSEEWRFPFNNKPLVEGSFKSANAHIIPLLDGSLLVYPSSINGNNYDAEPVLLDGSFLLQSSFKLANNEIVVGGISFSNTGLDPLNGKVKYHCGSFNCDKIEKTSEKESFHTLIVKRNAHQFRAADAVSGNERWNLSVSQYDLSLVSAERHVSSRQIEDGKNAKSYVNFKINQPNGRVHAKDSCGQELWTVQTESPVAKVWELYQGELSEVPLFDTSNIDDLSTISVSSNDNSLMAYFGDYKKNPYLIPSPGLREHLSDFSFWPNRDRLYNFFTSPYYRQHEAPKITAQNQSPDEDRKEDISTEVLSRDRNELNFEYDRDLELLKYYLGRLGKPQANLIEDKSRTDQSNLMCKIRTIIKGDKKFSNWLKLGSFIALSLTTYLFIRRRLAKKENKFKPSSEPRFFERNTSRESNTSFASSEFTSKFLQEFELEKCLGRGGFGIVFECRNRLDDCSYAVKRVAVSDDQAAIERVRREVKAMAKLDHPNIIRYYHTWLERPPPGWQQHTDSRVLLDLSCNPSTANAILNGHKKQKKLAKQLEVSSSVGKLIKKTPDESNDVHFELISNGAASDDGSWLESNGNTHINETIASESSDDEDLHVTDGFKSYNVTNSDTSSIVFEASKNVDSTPKEEQRSLPGAIAETNITPPVVLVASNNSDLVTSKAKRNYVYLYIQMQLCQQHTLSDWLHIHKSWKDRELQKMRGWFTQLLEAIEYIHRQGLIHRDLKPKNIFFDADGRLKVGDLGLATQYVDDIGDEKGAGFVDEGTRRSTHTSDVGTRSYMSPEQLKGQIYDYKVDVFSLGLIYTEMLIPFGTDMERIKTLEEIQNDHIENLKDRLPIEYEYVKWLTHQNPKERPTCKEVLQANFLRSKPPSSYGQVLKTTLNKLPGVRL